MMYLIFLPAIFLLFLFLSVFRDVAAEADRKKGTEKIAKAFEGSVQSSVREALAGSLLAAMNPLMFAFG